MAAVSAPPEGLSVFATGARGMATPPPAYPAFEKSTMRSPRGVAAYASLPCASNETHLLFARPEPKRAAHSGCALGGLGALSPASRGGAASAVSATLGAQSAGGAPMAHVPADTSWSAL